MRVTDGWKDSINQEFRIVDSKQGRRADGVINRDSDPQSKRTPLNPIDSHYLSIFTWGTSLGSCSIDTSYQCYCSNVGEQMH